jgi:hypothetical protein
VDFGHWLAVGCWLLAFWFWLLAVGCWLFAIGYWLLAIRYRLLVDSYSIVEHSRPRLCFMAGFAAHFSRINRKNAWRRNVLLRDECAASRRMCWLRDEQAPQARNSLAQAVRPG